MRLFDPHIHMTSRTTDDYQAMAAAGITAIVEPAFWVGQPRTHVGSFEDYFLSLLGWERFRAQSEGGERRPPRRGGPRAPAEVPREGRGRRGRRDRLRRSDRRRGPGLP